MLRAVLHGLVGALIVALVAVGHAQAAEILELQGRGVQIYTCVRVDESYSWKLKAPEATLLTPEGHTAGRHFAGPAWQAIDGSVVVGEVIASGSAPETAGISHSIPWLILRGKSHAGSGIFSAVSYVTRSRTVGGTAPLSGCDAAHVGVEARIPYSASYSFFSMK